MGCHSPIVFRIEAQIVGRERLVQGVGERLSVVGYIAREEIGKRCRRGSSCIAPIEKYVEVITQEISPELEGVLAEGNREIVHELVLRNVPAYRMSLALAQGSKAITRKRELRWKCLQRRGIVCRAKENSRPLKRPHELIHRMAVEGVGFVQLSLPFWLWTGQVEGRVDGIRRSGLHAVIGKYVQKNLILGADDLINTPRQQPFPGEVAGDGLKLQRARSPARHNKSWGTATTTGQNILSACRAGRVVVEGKNLVVKRNRSRTYSRQVCEGSGFEFRAGNIYRGSRRQHNPEPLVVHEEKCSVFPDRTSNRRSPLVHVVERPWRVASDIEIVVGIQRRTIPVVNRIAMKLVASRLAYEVDVGTNQSAVVA